LRRFRRKSVVSQEPLALSFCCFNATIVAYLQRFVNYL
jgi:hypothetical protein